jgi:hypothetical protein
MHIFFAATDQSTVPSAMTIQRVRQHALTPVVVIQLQTTLSERVVSYMSAIRTDIGYLAC